MPDYETTTGGMRIWPWIRKSPISQTLDDEILSRLSMADSLSCLRLYPDDTLVHVFLGLIYHRPLAESFQLFMMASRSGVMLHGGLFTNLLSRIARSSLPRAVVVRTQLEAAKALASCNGEISTLNIGQITNSFNAILLRLTEDRSEASARSIVVEKLVSTVRTILNCFVLNGGKMDDRTLATFMETAKYAEQPEMIPWAFAFAPSEDLFRHLCRTPESFDSLQHLSRTWMVLVAHSKRVHVQIQPETWKSLAKAVKSFSAEQQQFMAEQFSTLSHAIDEATMKDVQIILASDTNYDLATHDGFDAHSKVAASMNEPLVSLDEAERLEKQASDLFAMISKETIHDWASSPLPMNYSPDSELGPEAELRDIYDRISADPGVRPPPLGDGETLPRSKTGIPLDELRFQNWLSVNELLAKAEHHAAASGNNLTNVAVTEQPGERLEGYAGPETRLRGTALRRRILSLRGYPETETNHVGDMIASDNISMRA